MFLWLACLNFYSHVYAASTAPAVFIIKHLILRSETPTASTMVIYQGDNLMRKIFCCIPSPW